MAVKKIIVFIAGVEILVDVAAIIGREQMGAKGKARNRPKRCYIVGPAG